MNKEQPSFQHRAFRQARRSQLAGRLFAFCLLLLATPVRAQNLRYNNHRDVSVPEYATVRIGPFYSNVAFSQRAGYRYTRSSGQGTDYLINNRRGVIKEDGSDFPIVSALNFRNYLLITRRMDLDISVRLSWAYYPLDTQENEFNIDMPEEGIEGVLSSTVKLTPFVNGTISDRIIYRTDYVDTRGISDRLGGSEYEYLENTARADLDWLMAEDMNSGVFASRTDHIPYTDKFEDQERVIHSLGAVYEFRLIEGLITGVRAVHSETDYAFTNRADTVQRDMSWFARISRAETFGARGLLPIGAASGLEVSVGSTAGYTRNEPDGEQAADISSLITTKATWTMQLWRDFFQTLSYTRGLRRGFDAPFEEYEDWGYQLRYDKDGTGIRFYSHYTATEPTGVRQNEYNNWVTGVDIDLPLMEFLTLNMNTEYRIRDNKATRDEPTAAEGADLTDTPDVPEPDLEDIDDYQTWSAKIGTSLQVMKKVNLETYVQHFERMSDSRDLEFARDTFAVNLAYRHNF